MSNQNDNDWLKNIKAVKTWTADKKVLKTIENCKEKYGTDDLAVFVSAFGDLIQIVTAILKQISHSAQLWKVEVQAVAIQCHFADIGTQTVDAHSIHLI